MLQARADARRAEIEKLKAKAREARAEAKLSYLEEVDRLDRLREDAETKLSKLREAGDEAWEDLKEGTGQAMDALGKKIDEAKSRFK